MRDWLRKHPILAVFGMLFFVVFIAVAIAVYTSPSETIAARPNPETRRRPVIAGSSEPSAPVIVVDPAPVEMSRWGRFMLQAFMVVFGTAITIYAIQMLSTLG